jgi:hypothetical protein
MTKATVTVANVFTSAGKFLKGDVVDLPADEIKAINEIRFGALEAEKKPMFAKKAKAPAKKKRARNENGTLRADDPSTIHINEAWVND